MLSWSDWNFFYHQSNSAVYNVNSHFVVICFLCLLGTGQSVAILCGERPGAQRHQSCLFGREKRLEAIGKSHNCWSFSCVISFLFHFVYNSIQYYPLFLPLQHPIRKATAARMPENTYISTD